MVCGYIDNNNKYCNCNFYGFNLYIYCGINNKKIAQEQWLESFVLTMNLCDMCDNGKY